MKVRVMHVFQGSGLEPDAITGYGIWLFSTNGAFSFGEGDSYIRWGPFYSIHMGRRNAKQLRCEIEQTYCFST